MSNAWIAAWLGLYFLLALIVDALRSIRDELRLLREQEWKTTDELKKIKQLEKTK